MTPNQIRYIKVLTKAFIRVLGFDPNSPNLKATPDRVARMWASFLKEEPLILKEFPLKGKGGLILVRNHKAWSFCPHHFLPVEFTFRIGYIPEQRKVLGLSKLPRIANQVLKSLPLQEEIAPAVGQKIIQAISPRGVGVIVEGRHFCMRIRGVSSPCSDAVTTFFSGDLLEEGPAREEFISLGLKA